MIAFTLPCFTPPSSIFILLTIHPASAPLYYPLYAPTAIAILLLTPPRFALPRSPQQHAFDRAKRVEISKGVVEKVDSGAGKISVLTMHGAKGSKHERMMAAQIAKDNEQSTGDLGDDDPIRKNIERIIAFQAAEAAKVAAALLPSTAGSDPGQFIEPLGLCMHPTGGVLATDNSKARVQVFNSDGEVVR